MKLIDLLNIFLNFNIMKKLLFKKRTTSISIQFHDVYSKCFPQVDMERLLGC
jgi:hypothetical protein